MLYCHWPGAQECSGSVTAQCKHKALVPPGSSYLEAAYQAFANGMANVQMAGNLADAISGTIALADIRIAQGRLREAMRTYERAL